MNANARVDGLLLAAGAGRRMGKPKALLPGAISRSVFALREGGCHTITVVLGAAYDQARPLVPAGTRVVYATDWATGMAASLRAGLATLTGDAALLHLIDLPDVGAPVVRRLTALASPTALARASYHGEPGHPVLLGRDHWPAVIAEVTGDRGARDYLTRHCVVEVACEDLATGIDVDSPD